MSVNLGTCRHGGCPSPAVVECWIYAVGLRALCALCADALGALGMLERREREEPVARERRLMKFETDRETGEVTAFNDDLRVMAIGSTREEAAARFRAALKRRRIA